MTGPYEKDSILTKYFYHIGLGLMGAGTPVVHNYYLRRPYYSGIHRHIVLGIIGIYCGYYMDEFFKRKFAERDAVIKHYIELHPEDFVDKRRKFKEIFDEWYPQR
ncbi:NADH dehydrogenase [ubiquinone] 1 subunit C2-like [Uloborus diversus]|uniref:NADH dehydrogenase [ubiquinone] 1 subunit C2-like n=1 Tax=Uloborus diversus TaxID=327109 RepID=UPI002409A37D|nr:NADH dehydrogenase [ubiquinone] 1 subunit C2-like [Uloborus diversus]